MLFFLHLIKNTEKWGIPRVFCLTAKSLGFNDVDEIDPNPPVEVLDMLTFYDGCVAWLRLYDDMIDYTLAPSAATVKLD